MVLQNGQAKLLCVGTNNETGKEPMDEINAGIEEKVKDEEAAKEGQDTKEKGCIFSFFILL